MEVVQRWQMLQIQACKCEFVAVCPRISKSG